MQVTLKPKAEKNRKNCVTRSFDSYLANNMRNKTSLFLFAVPLDDEMIRQATLDEEWEGEVDDLVAWTSQLDENNIA